MKLCGIVAGVKPMAFARKQSAHFLSEESNWKNQVIHKTKPG